MEDTMIDLFKQWPFLNNLPRSGLLEQSVAGDSVKTTLPLSSAFGTYIGNIDVSMLKFGIMDCINEI
jgi:hypothetical protein